MQKWYNKLSKGQKFVLIPILAIIGLGLGSLTNDPMGTVFGAVLMLLPMLFFELGKKK